MESIDSSLYDFNTTTIDVLGRLKTGSEVLNGTTNNLAFNYNLQSELLNATIGSWQSNYNYHKDGNIANRYLNGTPETMAYNANLLTSVDSNVIAWDNNSNLSNYSQYTFNYTYDNKMEMATNIADPDKTVSMEYDPMGYRVEKITTEYVHTVSTAYDFGSSVEKYVNYFVAGVSLNNIMYSVVIDVGCDYIGGKGLDFLAGGGIKLLNKFKGKLGNLGTYRELVAARKKLGISGKDVEIHHLIEKRFNGTIGQAEGDMLSIALDP